MLQSFYRDYSKAILILFYRIWVHTISASKLKICINQCQTKGNLFVSSAASIEPIRALLLDTTRGLKAPQTLAALATTFAAPQNNSLEQFFFQQYSITFSQKGVGTIRKLEIQRELIGKHNMLSSVRTRCHINIYITYDVYNIYELLNSGQRKRNINV